MKKFRISLGLLALALTLGTTYSMSANAQDDRPCSTQESGSGTVGTVSSLGCGGNISPVCCYLIADDTQIRFPD